MDTFESVMRRAHGNLALPVRDVPDEQIAHKLA